MPLLAIPSDVNFGLVNQGDTVSSVVQLRNNNNFTVTVSDISQPVVDSSFASTTPTPFTIVSGAAVFITLTFHPLDMAVHTSVFEVSSDSPDTPAIINVTGTSVTAGTSTLGVSPSSWDFGSEKVGVPSAEKLFVLTNTGTHLVVISALNFAVPFAAGPTTLALPFTLAVGASVNVGAVFNPVGRGFVSQAAGLSVVSDASNSPLNVLLSGTGFPIVPAFVLNGQVTPPTLAAFFLGGVSVVMQFDSTNLNCEELCRTDKLVNFDAPSLEKSLYVVQVDYEDLGPASLIVRAFDRRGDTLSQTLSIGTFSASQDVLRELADFQMSEEVIHIQYNVIPNAGPISITGYSAWIEPAGEVRKDA